VTNQVFVSYSSKSKNAVTFLKSFLESNNITSIWHDEDKLVAGVNVAEYIRRGVLESACCIFLLDEHSSTSAWCMAEVGAFWGANKPVIVYRANDGCEVPPFFAGIKVANSPDEIVRAVKAIPEKPQRAHEVTTDSRDVWQLVNVEETDKAILEKVAAMSTLEILIGKDAIEQAATKIIRASGDSDEIIATSQYSNQDSLSDEYINAMAERVKRAVSDKGEMEVRVVMSAKPDTEQLVEDRRTQIFREKGIDDRLNTRRAKHGWPLEVLIVGNAMIIALRRGGKRSTYEVAIKIEDQEFVYRASKWFREAVWGEADQNS